MLPNHQCWGRPARIRGYSWRCFSARAEACRFGLPWRPLLFGYECRHQQWSCDSQNQLQRPNIPVQGNEPTIASGPQVRSGRVRQLPNSTGIGGWGPVVLSNSGSWPQDAEGTAQVQTRPRSEARSPAADSKACESWANNFHSIASERSRSGFTVHASERRFRRGCCKRANQPSLAWPLPNVRATRSEIFE